MIEQTFFLVDSATFVGFLHNIVWEICWEIDTIQIVLLNSNSFLLSCLTLSRPNVVVVVLGLAFWALGALPLLPLS